MADLIRLTLTPVQAKVLWNTCDGQADAGACVGGNTPREQRALQQIMEKMLPQYNKFKNERVE